MTRQEIGPKVAINVTEILQSARRFMLGDFDDFQEVQATADTERWTSAYYTGSEGGSADINTTTSGKLCITEDPDASPTAAGYAVTYTEPLESRFYQTITDVSTTFGAQTSGNAEAGIMVTKGSAYDSTNYLSISRYNTSSVHRVSVQGKLNNSAITTVNATVTDNAVALRVDRAGDVWKFYYSLSVSPTEEWVFLAEVEDSSSYMTDQTTPMLYSYTSGDNTDNSVVGNFDNWKLYISAMALDEAIGLIGRNTADNLVSTSSVTLDVDGSVLERLESLIKIIANSTIYTSSAATTTTITAAALADVASQYIGQLVIPLSGAMAGEARYITAYNGTNALTVSPAWASDPDAAGNITFAVISSGLSIVPTALGTDGTTVTDSATTVLGAVGANNADNAFSSSNVVENRDGSVLERTEYLIGEVEDDTDSVQNRIGNLTGRTNDGNVAAALGIDNLPDVASGDLYTLLWKYMINTAISSPTTKTGLQYVQAVGSDDNNNDFASTNVVANSNGSIIERLEHILIALGGTTGTTTALGLTTTAIDTVRTEAADYWNGGVFVCVDGANAGLARPIYDFDATADTLYFEPAFPNAVAASVNYVILTRYDVARLIGDNNADNAISTSTVAANEDGSVLERLEQIQEAVNIGAGTSIASGKSLVDVIGQTGAITSQTGDVDAINIQNRLDANNLATGIVAAAGADGFEEDGTGGRLYDVFNSTDVNANVFSMDGGTDYNDNVFSFLKTLSKYTADGDGDFAAGQPLPANTSLVDVLGDFTGPHDGAAYDDNVLAHLKKLSTYIADGDGDYATGTANPANKSLYDLLWLDKSSDAGNTTGFTCTLAMDVNETDVATLTNGTALTGTTRRKITYWLDMTNIDADVGGGNCTIRVKAKVDQTNYRTVDTITWVNGTSDNGVSIEIPPFDHNLQLTFQMSVALAGNVSVPYRIVTENMEY